MSMPWFRMYSEFSSDPKVQLLAFEDQRHFVVILCLKCNGILNTDATTPAHFEKLVCKALGLDITAGMEAKRRLIEVGLIGEDWQPTKWDARQYSSDSSTKRVRDYREKQRETLLKRYSNGDVTDKNRTEQIQNREELRIKSRKAAISDFESKPVADLKSQIFASGVSLGLTRSVIGLGIKNSSEQDVLAAIVRMSIVKPAEPKSYFFGLLKTPEQRARAARMVIP